MCFLSKDIHPSTPFLCAAAVAKLILKKNVMDLPINIVMSAAHTPRMECACVVSMHVNKQFG